MVVLVVACCCCCGIVFFDFEGEEEEDFDVLVQNARGFVSSKVPEENVGAEVSAVRR